MAEDENENLGRLLASLPPAQRVDRYREIAADALRRASIVKDMELKASFLSIASAWQVLATEVERAAGLQIADLGGSGRGDAPQPKA